MKIYNAEADLKDKMTNKTIAFTSQLKHVAANQTLLDRLSNKYHLDAALMYPTLSILVSTTWNLNDDVFHPIEVWRARHTPVNKPDNINHDEAQIVGHMIHAEAIDANGNIIPDDTDEANLPDLFHILNTGVIYSHWSQAELRNRYENLIAAIESGEMFVSMECLFANFDYALANGSESFIIQRAEESSFLTKHLRIYGGSGEYNGYRVGRLIRDLSFCGKGYVRNPGNPDSVILSFGNDVYENPLVKSSGVYLFCRELHSIAKIQMENDMSDSNMIAKAEYDAVNVQLATANAKIEEMNAKLEEELAKLADTEAKLSTVATEKEELAQKLEDAVKESKALADKVAALELEKRKADRINQLILAGVNKDKAEEKVAKFINLDDEQFAAIAEDIVAAVNTNASLDDVSETENGADTSVASDDEADDIAKARAEMVKAAAEMLGVTLK